MSSPNEPGAPSPGDNPNGDGAAERAGAHRAATGRAPDAADSPPWQRGAARTTSQSGPRPAADPPTDVRTPTSSEARLNRFISGGSTPTPTPANPSKEPPAARADNTPAEAYASELPDLSGPIPRPTQRKSTPERSADTATSSGRTAGEARESRAVAVGSRRGRGPVRASMQIRRIDPWSTLKVSLLLSVALFFVWMIAVAFLYLVLGGMGVWSKLNSNVGDLLNNTSGSSGELVSSGTIFGGAVLIGLVNIVLMTAMATIAAFVYNLTTDLIGGIEVTLADRD
ncbi:MULTISPECIES: DUF3566 domain-containing protein [Mycobacterium]|uniref:DUF3566 domain-containing protein n=1 Tax=Mycobacterium kiyosense TaxID=2871094 RepID=A0A9P3QBZ0_9MYCO|nr:MULTISPECIES: DUF3566 domain-containing protein [Mycobacterium]BDE11430.1 hypothetical protein MKCMC460_02900 [Mycobacterium sp. 20KCMC460]GLB84974.1 hypothetical protein SRL2020028_42300 [Mycobacterium kiyosense]GLB92150.1 hypothetical protein SRL2020130_49670 [Mycobacterium kiyosense]GLB98184.1 hypothetical protein SRL2020226_49600 [Mycobacterium kiyosense]GLC04357.1 hypothetical protein SRL2020400_49480 [Mycobacterium kiyosense]